MNLFQKPKLELHLFQQYFTPHIPPLNKARVKPPSVQIPPKHTQKFNKSFLYMFQIVQPNQCHISRPATARKHQWDSRG